MSEIDTVGEAARALHDAERDLRDAERRRRIAIKAARATGATWASIGAAAGVTRHRAHQIAYPGGTHSETAR